jgi:hypothetical protein
VLAGGREIMQVKAQVSRDQKELQEISWRNVKGRNPHIFFRRAATNYKQQSNSSTVHIETLLPLG